jgi:predicted MFS family arabinose efflux permease
MTQTTTVAGRLRPLQVSLVLGGIAPWVPVEKVFMTQLGFTPGLVATMAAAYAAVVPLVQIPSGILADRWSRRGVLMLATVASLASVVTAALSHGVGTYIVSAMILGVYFAMHSGTVDSIVYDTLLEEVGHADDFERQYGRIQGLTSAALTASALAGGAIAALASARLTYVLTVPTSVLALVVLSRFREPTLHRAQEATRLREHVAATWHTMTSQPRVIPIAVTMMLSSALLQMLFEFGPLWLVSLALPALVFGPYTAAMTSTLGLGGLAAGRLRLDRPAGAASVAAVMTGCALTLSLPVAAWAVIAGQVVLAVLLVTVGIHVSKLLHEIVPSTMRSAVSSGIGTMSWLTFLPASLLFGAVGNGGVRSAGWIFVTLAAVTGATLVRITRRERTPVKGGVANAPAIA